MQWGWWEGRLIKLFSVKHSHSLPSLPCSFNLLQCWHFITFSPIVAPYSWLGFTPNPSAAEGVTEWEAEQRGKFESNRHSHTHREQNKINWVHTGHAFYLIFHPGISGLVLKVENENDFHPWSPVNCAVAKIQSCIKEQRRAAQAGMSAELRTVSISSSAELRTVSIESEPNSGTHLYNNRNKPKLLSSVFFF